MFGFMQRKQQKQAEAKAKAINSYSELVEIMSKVGDLSDEDGDRMEQAASKIGLPLTGEGPSVAHHIEVITDHRNYTEEAKQLPALTEAMEAAQAKLREHQAETDRLVKELTVKRKAAADKLEADLTAKQERRTAAEIAKSRSTILADVLRDYTRIVDEGRDAIPDAREKWERREKLMSDRFSQIHYSYCDDEKQAMVLRDAAGRIHREVNPLTDDDMAGEPAPIPVGLAMRELTQAERQERAGVE